MKRWIVLTIQIVIWISCFALGWIFTDIVKHNIREEIRNEVRQEMQRNE